MPRPSLKDQRSTEILDAYLTCVAQFGLEGATQERIAAQAGVKRPLLRHYLGNKDQMIDHLAAHVVGEFAVLTDGLAQVTGDLNSPSDLVELLFSKEGGTDPRLMLTWQALTAAVGDHPNLRQPLLSSLQQFLTLIETTLGQLAPDAGPATLRAVAQGISAVYVSLDAMSPLAPPDDWQGDLKQAAMILAAGLEGAK